MQVPVVLPSKSGRTDSINELWELRSVSSDEGEDGGGFPGSGGPFDELDSGGVSLLSSRRAFYKNSRSHVEKAAGPASTSRGSTRSRKRKKTAVEYNLVWAQCTKCGKWRLALEDDPKLEGDWECFEEFWSDTKQDWVDQCSVPQDPDVPPG